MERRCFSPPESLIPFSPMMVSIPSGARERIGIACALRKASRMSASEASALTNCMFSLMLPA